jgi:hypothetical protein
MSDFLNNKIVKNKESSFLVPIVDEDSSDSSAIDEEKENDNIMNWVECSDNSGLSYWKNDIIKKTQYLIPKCLHKSILKDKEIRETLGIKNFYHK